MNEWQPSTGDRERREFKERVGGKYNHLYRLTKKANECKCENNIHHPLNKELK